MTGIKYFTSKSIYQTKSNLGYWMRKERLTHDYFLIKKRFYENVLCANRVVDLDPYWIRI